MNENGRKKGYIEVRNDLWNAIRRRDYKESGSGQLTRLRAT